MLPQALALLALGALCSSAPVQTPAPAAAAARLPQDLCSNTSIVYAIQEILVDVGSLTVRGSTTVPVKVTVKRCIRSNLRTLSESLSTFNKTVANRLARFHGCENLFDQGPDDECTTAEVTNEKVIREQIETFLKYLHEELL